MNAARLVIVLIIVGLSSILRADKGVIFVSILPQKYFVEQITGHDWDIKVMVKPGQSPVTYEPTPKQMMELADAEYYCSIGVQFERIWLAKVVDNYSDLKIINTIQDIELIGVTDWKELTNIMNSLNNNENISHGHLHQTKGTNERGHSHSNEMMDPHTWLSPELIKIQTRNIYNYIVKDHPEKRNEYRSNLENFIERLNKLQTKLINIFEAKEHVSFLVFHPAWGYFAREFGLEQIPIEVEGKSPTPKEMGAIIKFCREMKIKAIFVQKQFSQEIAQSIADSIGGKVILLDPLAENYFDNLLEIAKKLAEN